MDSMIEDKILQIWKNRRDAISKFMDEYDAKVYNPQLEAVQKECGELGHDFSYQDNSVARAVGLHVLNRCVNCGAIKDERTSNT